MDELTCIACGRGMTLSDKRTAKCSNPGCPEGGLFFFCGYCHAPSFAMAREQMHCVNPECRSYHRKRHKCPSCQKVAIIQFGRRMICVNRECPDNRDVISMCFFCSNRAYLKEADLQFCTKGNCRYLFARVEACPACKAQSFVVDEKMCQNSGCTRAGIPVDPCPQCNQRTLSQDAGGARVCLSETCGYRSDTTLDATLMTMPPLPSSKDDAALGGGTIALNPSQSDPAYDPTRPLPRVIPDAKTPVSPLRPPQAAPPEALFAKPLAKAPTPPPMKPPPPPPLPRSDTPRPLEAYEAPPLPPPPVEYRPKAVFPAGPQSGIEAVWAHLKSTFLTGKARSPIYLVIGLEGAGKTTYLTMIGEILRCKNDKYCFPYDGLETRWMRMDEGVADPQRLQLLRSRVKDLVWGFAQEHYQQSLSRMHWPVQTVQEQGDDQKPTTFFLVTEIVRHHKSLGHIITLETAGEHYKEVLKQITGYMTGAPPANPTHRVLLEMMDQAEGILILLDPESPHNDAAYGNFFMVLKEELRPRALNVFSRELRGALPGQGGGKDADLRAVLKRLTEEESQRLQWEARFEEEKYRTSEKLREIQQALLDLNAKVLEGAEGDLLRNLESLLQKAQPGRVQEARDRAVADPDPDRRLRNVLRYYHGLAGICLEQLDELLRLKHKEAHGTPTESSLWEIKHKYGLSEHFKVAADSPSLAEHPVKHFRGLRNLAIVVTKADRCPIVYPPEHYPRQKLPGCWMHLRELEDYLKLCSGAIRYYNTSATGYTMLMSGMHVPGWLTSQTPINILEPLFDMMQIP